MKQKFFIFSFTLVFALTPLLFVSASEPIKVLLVPGHDDKSFGAQYGNVREAAMNLAVASRMYDLLKKDERFEVSITRDTKGYTKEFSDYFSMQEEDILSFRDEAKNFFIDLIEDGLFIEKETVPHNTVSGNTSVVLYGINKWANENAVDAVIHVHFNDYLRKNKWVIGDRNGFAVYIPDEQMANGLASKELAAHIFTKLKEKYTTSNYVEELGGFIEDHKLIALGSNGTLAENVRSVLVEYGYIYEKKFRNYTTRHRAYDDMAKLTVQGMENYFFPKE